jgi:uncharacterized membrane protein (UPF0136 family)
MGISDDDIEEGIKMIAELGFEITEEELIEFADRLCQAAKEMPIITMQIESITTHYYNDDIGEEDEIFSMLPVLHRFVKDLL